MRFVPAMIECLGSTGLQVAEILWEMVERRLGAWPLFWAMLLAETTTERPRGIPAPWDFVALGLPLDQLYDRRFALPLRAGVERAPQIVWEATFLGAGKRPITAAIAHDVRGREMTAARTAGWSQLSSRRAEEDLLRTLGQHPGTTAGDEPASVWIVTAANGSTGPACTVRAVAHWLEHPARPRVQVLALGPHCGPTHDDYASDEANCRSLLLALQRQVERRENAGRLWVFQIDRPKEERDTVLYESAAFLAEQLMEPAGRDLRRLLQDSFTIARERDTLAGEPPRFLCQLDVRRYAVPAERLRRRKALDALCGALDQEGGLVS